MPPTHLPAPWPRTMYSLGILGRDLMVHFCMCLCRNRPMLSKLVRPWRISSRCRLPQRELSVGAASFAFGVEGSYWSEQAGRKCLVWRLSSALSASFLTRQHLQGRKSGSKQMLDGLGVSKMGRNVDAAGEAPRARRSSHYRGQCSVMASNSSPAWRPHQSVRGKQQ